MHLTIMINNFVDIVPKIEKFEQPVASLSLASSSCEKSILFPTRNPVVKARYQILLLFHCEVDGERTKEVQKGHACQMVDSLRTSVRLLSKILFHHSSEDFHNVVLLGDTSDSGEV
jgi:hypothetical protein